MSLEKEIKDKSRRPMQEAGVYDPMEQAGQSDMVSTKFVLKELGEVADKIRKRKEDFPKTNLDSLFVEGGISLLDWVLALLVEKKENQTK